MGLNDPAFGTDKLLSTQDLLPRAQLLNALRGGTTEAQEIEQYIRQTFAYMVGFQPASTTNGLVVPTLLSAESNGALDVTIKGTVASPPFFIQFPEFAQINTVTHAVNTVDLGNAGSPTQNVIYIATAFVSGSGTMPTAAAPLNFAIYADATPIYQGRIIAAGQTVLLQGFPGGITGGYGVDNTVTISDGGANVTTDLNVVWGYFGNTN